MYTAVTYRTENHYFGRTLDIDRSYHEQVTITPRRFPLAFRKMKTLEQHFALIGMATIANGCPLYYDATNEKGLSMAGLNFPQNAAYLSCADGADNLAPFEFIPWILGQCGTVSQARTLLARIRLVDISFSEQLPLTPLHWMLADRDEAIVIEPMRDGLRIYDDPVGVLTNNPPFDYQMTNLNNYMQLTAKAPVNRFSDKLPLYAYSFGMGALGLPGDLSSVSRFVRAAFTKMNSVSGRSENESVSQFFHILGSVAQTRGCAQIGDEFEITRYTSCCNTDKGIYYYTTYENQQITAVDLHAEDLERAVLIPYSLITTQQIRWQNR